MAVKLVDKKAGLDWDAFREGIFSSTPVDNTETDLQKRQRIARLEADFEAWVKYHFPKYAYAEPADFHKKAAKRVLNNMEWYESRAWARELAKDTRTMFEVLYLGLTGKKSNIMLVSNSLDNAERLLEPYRAQLDSNQRIIADYGEQVTLTKKWTSTEFVTSKGVSFRALGAGQSPRGARNEHKRPDLLIISDLDTDEECNNPDLIDKKWAWVEGALIGTRSISEPLMVIFLNNIIADYCCMTKAMEMADHVDIVNIRGKDGRSTWPQKNTEAHIDRVLSKVSYASGQREYFNNPITEGKVFKALSYKNLPPIHEYGFLVCYTDPSFKDSKKNDYKATMLVGRWRDEFHVIRAYCEQTSTAQLVRWHYDIMDLVGEHACYYYMEANFLQDVILKEFYETGRLQGKMVPIVGDERKKPDKFTRIESLLEPLNRNGKLWFNLAEKDTLGMKNTQGQFKALSPKSRAHDDAPDAVEGAVWMLNNKLDMLGDGAIKTVGRSRNSKRY